MTVNINDKTRDYKTDFTTSKPSTGNSYVDQLIAGNVIIEQRPDQQQPTATRPRT